MNHFGGGDASGKNMTGFCYMRRYHPGL